MPERFQCHREVRDIVRKTGYVTKLGGAHDGKTGNWKKRFMVLKDDLYYYEDEDAYDKGKDAKGVIQLDSYFVVKKDGENENCEFTIFAVPKPLVCHALCREDMDSWYELLTGFGR